MIKVDKCQSSCLSKNDLDHDLKKVVDIMKEKLLWPGFVKISILL
jgi:hypothetical protein